MTTIPISWEQRLWELASIAWVPTSSMKLSTLKLNMVMRNTSIRFVKRLMSFWFTTSSAQNPSQTPVHQEEQHICIHLIALMDGLVPIAPRIIALAIARIVALMPIMTGFTAKVYIICSTNITNKSNKQYYLPFVNAISNLFFFHPRGGSTNNHSSNNYFKN